MLCRYLQAAAALVLYPDCSAQQQLMALVCRVPAQFLTPAMMRLATAAWHWICAAQPRLQVRQAGGWVRQVPTASLPGTSGKHSCM